MKNQVSDFQRTDFQRTDAQLQLNYNWWMVDAVDAVVHWMEKHFDRVAFRISYFVLLLVKVNWCRVSVG